MKNNVVLPSIRFEGDTPESLKKAELAIRDLCNDDSGTFLVDFASTVDGVIFSAEGSNGCIELEILGDRINGWVRCGDEARQLDAEDTIGVTDGRVHSLAVTVDESGTHLFVDGYEAFSATLGAWFSQIALEQIQLDPNSMMDIRRFIVWDAALEARGVMAQSVTEKPLIEFATSELSRRDAHRTGELDEGALRARFRTRGEGQGGVVLQAKGLNGLLTLGVDEGDLYYTVEQADEIIASTRAPGHWDDGDWHDIVLVSGRGALNIYADGYQVTHEAGTAFFSEISPVERVVVGTDVQGSRLFGEAQIAMIYNAVLSDHQVKRLASVEPLSTRALFDTGMAGSKSYRIPALLTLKSGVVIAGADRRVSIANDSPNDISFALRRSLDGGKTWEGMQTLIEYPGTGRLGASVIDSVIVQDEDSGRVIVLIDMFPGGCGQPNVDAGTGFDALSRNILHNRAGETFYLDSSSGSVVDSQDNPTQYKIAANGDVTYGGDPAGNIHLAYGVDPNESLFTTRTCYFQMIFSEDDGATWSQPIDITSQVKEEWMRFFGTSPGNGIQIKSGKYKGRLLMPVYYNHEEGKTFSCAAVFSDDGGVTWTRGASPNDGRVLYGDKLNSRKLEDDRGSLHESALVEGENGDVHVYMRNQHPSGSVAHAVSQDGGQTWGDVTYLSQLPEIFSQPNAIKVTDENGMDATVFANASMMLPFRGRGVLRLSYDHGKTWPHNKVLNPRHHVYQSMTQLPDGRLAILWEREWQGLFLTTLPLSWITSSRSTES